MRRKENAKTALRARRLGIPLLFILFCLTGCEKKGVLDMGPAGQEAVRAEAEQAAVRLAQAGNTSGNSTANGGECPGTSEKYAGNGASPNDASGNMTAGNGTDQEKKEPPAGWELVLASEDWGLSFGESGAQPTGNAAASDLAWYDAYYVGSGEEKIIYLTFDCGYENGNTEPILDALKKHNATGTFFVVGHYLETAPELVKRMVAEGHAVGNHTYHHPDMPSISRKEDFQKELDGVADLFQEITGARLSPYYRPPQGKCNVENLKLAQELGYHTIFWSLAHVDWNQDKQPGRQESIDKLTSRVHPGAIVLLHNTSSTNGEILDELLTRWEEMGYSFRPLSELTEKSIPPQQ